MLDFISSPDHLLSGCTPTNKMNEKCENFKYNLNYIITVNADVTFRGYVGLKKRNVKWKNGNNCNRKHKCNM